MCDLESGLEPDELHPLLVVHKVVDSHIDTAAGRLHAAVDAAPVDWLARHARRRVQIVIPFNRTIIKFPS